MSGKPTGKLAGISELAEMAGVTRQGARKLSQRKDFPEPIDWLSGGTRPIWWRKNVAAWLRKRAA